MDVGKLELTGRKRERTLSAMKRQFAEWGIVMPADGPYPLHFGLHDFDKIGETEFLICNEENAGYCGKFLFLFEGQTCPAHHHHEKHETFFVLKGRMHLRADGEEFHLNQGDTKGVAPGTRHEFKALDGPLLLLEVSMPSRVWDNVFADDRINALLPTRPGTGQASDKNE